jgi:hypothetical protein
MFIINLSVTLNVLGNVMIQNVQHYVSLYVNLQNAILAVKNQKMQFVM